MAQRKDAVRRLCARPGESSFGPAEASEMRGGRGGVEGLPRRAIVWVIYFT